MSKVKNGPGTGGRPRRDVLASLKMASMEDVSRAALPAGEFPCAWGIGVRGSMGAVQLEWECLANAGSRDRVVGARLSITCGSDSGCFVLEVAVRDGIR